MSSFWFKFGNDFPLLDKCVNYYLYKAKTKCLKNRICMRSNTENWKKIVVLSKVKNVNMKSNFWKVKHGEYNNKWLLNLWEIRMYKSILKIKKGSLIWLFHGYELKKNIKNQNDLLKCHKIHDFRFGIKKGFAFLKNPSNPSRARWTLWVTKKFRRGLRPPRSYNIGNGGSGVWSCASILALRWHGVWGSFFLLLNNNIFLEQIFYSILQIYEICRI